MCWGISFEVLFRLAAQMNGLHVLRRSMKGKDQRMFQYKMLTTWEGGLYSDEALERILQSIPKGYQRDLAKKTVMLAGKARDAFSHGALVTWNEHTHLGIGHLFAKSIQALITSIIHCMTEEGAYYNWLKQQKVSGRDLDNWLLAEKSVLRNITLRASSF